MFSIYLDWLDFNRKASWPFNVLSSEEESLDRPDEQINNVCVFYRQGKRRVKEWLVATSLWLRSIPPTSSSFKFIIIRSITFSHLIRGDDRPTASSEEKRDHLLIDGQPINRLVRELNRTTRQGEKQRKLTAITWSMIFLFLSAFYHVFGFFLLLSEARVAFDVMSSKPLGLRLRRSQLLHSVVWCFCVVRLNAIIQGMTSGVGKWRFHFDRS